MTLRLKKELIHGGFVLLIDSMQILLHSSCIWMKSIRELREKVCAAAELRVNSKPKQTALAIEYRELPNLVLYPLKY